MFFTCVFYRLLYVCLYVFYVRYKCKRGNIEGNVHCFSGLLQVCSVCVLGLCAGSVCWIFLVPPVCWVRVLGLCVVSVCCVHVLGPCVGSVCGVRMLGLRVGSVWMVRVVSPRLA